MGTRQHQQQHQLLRARGRFRSWTFRPKWPDTSCGGRNLRPKWIYECCSMFRHRDCPQSSRLGRYSNKRTRLNSNGWVGRAASPRSSPSEARERIFDSDDRDYDEVEEEKVVNKQKSASGGGYLVTASARESSWGQSQSKAARLR